MTYIKKFGDLENKSDRFYFLDDLTSKNPKELYHKEFDVWEQTGVFQASKRSGYYEDPKYVKEEELIILQNDLPFYLIGEYEQRLKYINEEVENNIDRAIEIAGVSIEQMEILDELIDTVNNLSYK